MESDYLMVASDTTTAAVNTNIKLDSLVWNYVALIFQNQSGGPNVVAYHNQTRESFQTIDLTPGPFSAIYLAGGPDEAGSGGGLLDQQSYVGLIQDVGLYSRSLTSSEISSLVGGAISLSGASFLPQCLCPTGLSASDDMQTCGGESVVDRYAQEMYNNIYPYSRCASLHGTASPKFTVH